VRELERSLHGLTRIFAPWRGRECADANQRCADSARLELAVS
jgi:hypothetical protein